MESSRQQVKQILQMLSHVGEKFQMKLKPKPNALEILDTPLDPHSDLKPYLVGVFGSAFGGLQGNFIQIILNYRSI